MMQRAVKCPACEFTNTDRDPICVRCGESLQPNATPQARPASPPPTTSYVPRLGDRLEQLLLKPTLPKPLKYGLVCAGVYITVFSALVCLGSTGWMGHGENNGAAWLLIFLAVPGGWLLQLMGLRIASVLPVDWLVGFVLCFLLGAFVGSIRRAHRSPTPDGSRI
jgi:hypothetical protein